MCGSPLRELALDLEEGADIMVMVKPADRISILARVADSVDVPVAAYQISGEYSMIEAAAEGLDRPRQGHPGDADRHQAGRRPEHPHLLGHRGRAEAPSGPGSRSVGQRVVQALLPVRHRELVVHVHALRRERRVALLPLAKPTTRVLAV